MPIFGQEMVVQVFSYATILYENHGYDCRFNLPDPTCLSLGETYKLEVRFLSPELVREAIPEGAPIDLWDGKTVATGTLVRYLET